MVAKFLNRILGLEVARQQYLFDYFARYLELAIKTAMRDGRYHKGIQNFAGRSVLIDDGNERSLKIQTPSQFPLKLVPIKIDRGMDWDAALDRLEESRMNNTAAEPTQDEDAGQRLGADSRGQRTAAAAAGTAADGNAADGNAASGTAANPISVAGMFADAERSRPVARTTRNSKWSVGNFSLPKKVHEARFGDRDGFRVNERSNDVCLIIEVGEASMRGLSVKTDKFLQYHPHKDSNAIEWKIVSFSYGAHCEADEARTIWTRAFSKRAQVRLVRLFCAIFPACAIFPEVRAVSEVPLTES
ncbi:hypothetical protein M885DRAFT_57582 [Pelagophyceae sp. CCMP2097]|nr:hypothetical protein M885DRAFT_57582 [Pelagophyceae sp. CCMP2097]